MGKPYDQELRGLSQTYDWALNTPTHRLRSFVDAAASLPLIAVGSGGSLTAAHMAALLHQRSGKLSKAVTPLEFVSSSEPIGEASVLILTAGGRNTDILNAFRFAAISEPRQLMALCMRTQSPLATIARQFRFSDVVDYDLPSGRDGFLATNSLLATLTILIRAYGELLPPDYRIPTSLQYSDDTSDPYHQCTREMASRETWIVLYGGWALPPAIDIESKLTEAALCRVQIADYRNFAHGRHHWLAKRPSETAILALITPEYKRIAEKTLGLLPHDVPVLRLPTNIRGPVGGLDLFTRALYLASMVGSVRGIDPGKPGVPTFGRNIYHIHYSGRDAQWTAAAAKHREEIAITRKVGCSLAELCSEELKHWAEAYRSFNERLRQAAFGAVVFDYDGTLCDRRERFDGPPRDIGAALVQLLKHRIAIGIATGRGRSAKLDLRKLIPAEHWEQILIGYYNGSDIAPLSDDGHPHKLGPTHYALEPIKDALETYKRFYSELRYECRPMQITVEPSNGTEWDRIRRVLMSITAKDASSTAVRTLESSHSIDILAPGVSKLNLVVASEGLARQIGNSGSVLCIGDRGEWPGNDHDLLSTPYSLSVDRVSPDPMTCWNLCLAGHRGVQGTLEYLRSKVASGGVLRLKLGEDDKGQ